jgi:septum formation protein
VADALRRGVVLASASPRRVELLSLISATVDAIPADVDEQPLPGESPTELVLRLATAKARAVAHRPDVEADRFVIGADTVVVVGEMVVGEMAAGEILGKPTDERDAVRMLGMLRGREHQVLTGVAIIRLEPATAVSFVESTTVWFADLTDPTIHDYVATGEPLDKAGAYGIQGAGGAFVTRIHGSYQNVVGLPVAQLAAALDQLDQNR